MNSSSRSRTAFTVLIADDEPLARDRLRMAVSAVPEFELVAECDDGLRAVEQIRALTPDLVLLDVEMPGLDGFGVIRTIGVEHMPVVVFVTAFDDYAVRAFEARAIDYVLKPFENDRVRDVLQHARDQIGLRCQSDIARRLAHLIADLPLDPVHQRKVGMVERYPARLTVRDDERVRFIVVTDIDWIQGDRNYVKIHVGAREHRIRDSLAALTDRLDPQQFARIHKSTIVNIDRIAEVQPWFGGDYVAILRDGKRLRVSRTFAPSLFEPR